jgi:hypothetical protein
MVEINVIKNVDHMLTFEIIMKGGQTSVMEFVARATGALSPQNSSFTVGNHYLVMDFYSQSSDWLKANTTTCYVHGQYLALKERTLFRLHNKQTLKFSLFEGHFLFVPNNFSLEWIPEACVRELNKHKKVK